MYPMFESVNFQNVLSSVEYSKSAVADETIAIMSQQPLFLVAGNYKLDRNTLSSLLDISGRL